MIAVAKKEASFLKKKKQKTFIQWSWSEQLADR